MKSRIAILAMAVISVALLTAPANSLQRRGPPDLARYAGRYPFDRIDGVRFLDHPIVRQAVTNAAPTPRIRARILEEGTSGVIVVTRALVLASACEPHNCGSHNWTIVIGRRKQAHFVCYKPDGGTARWYRRQRAVASGDTCPFDAAEVPVAVQEAL